MSITRFRLSLESLNTVQNVLETTHHGIENENVIEQDDFTPAGAAELNQTVEKALDKVEEGDSILVPSLSSALNPEQYRTSSHLAIEALKELEPKLVDAMMEENTKVSDFIDNEIKARQEQTNDTLTSIENLTEADRGDVVVSQPDEANAINKLEYDKLRFVIHEFTNARLDIEKAYRTYASPFLNALQNLVDGNGYTYIHKEVEQTKPIVPIMTTSTENIERVEVPSATVKRADVFENKTIIIGVVSEVITNAECLSDYKAQYNHFVDSVKELFIALKATNVSEDTMMSVYHDFAIVLCKYRKTIMNLVVYINSVSNTLAAVVKAAT